MRRPLGLILVTLGAFCLTLAPLVRFYVADKVVVAPLNRYQKTVLEAQNAEYFDTAAFKSRKGVTLVATNTVRGDVRANNGNDRIAVWDASTELYDKESRKQVDIQGYRIAFDRRTGELVNCCGVQVSGDTNVQMSGFGLLYPLANVRKRDYPFYDMTTKQPVPMRFDGEERLGAMDTYRFVQRIPLTKAEAMDLKVPANMLGMEKTMPAQKVDRYFMATVTQWVDPRTGIPVRVRQNISSTLTTPDGQGSMVVAKADLITTPASQRGLMDLSSGQATRIALVETWVPVGGLFGGLVLLLIGSVIGMSGAKRKEEPLAPRRPDGKFGDARTAAQESEAPDAPRRADGKFGGDSVPADTRSTDEPAWSEQK
ncbi:DUF3068 domain-containing protein [Actinomadura flavalba]|uniref:DUF3068 domain-containing protein n=1 Tax=Actinomadura flavalba TaxID=1120938 RepID=UPI0003689C46|nr:DUF3068 domain-containing protein [Actinomadura flavalba]